MNPDFLSQFQQEKIAVNCQTEDEANEFLYHLHNAGLKWASGSSPIEYNLWSKHSERTAYICEEHHRVRYADAGYRARR